MAFYDVGLNEIDAAAFHGVRFAHSVEFASVAVDATLPVISDVTPAAAAELEATDPVAFKVTDTGGNLARTTVLAYYPALRRFEVVYFGTGFAAGADTFSAGFGPQYTGTRGAIADGFQFSDVVRLGGWPAAPTFVIDAGDTAGNESA